MVIDFHTHVFSPKVRKNRDEYAARDPCFAILYSQPKAKLATADELITSMDKEDIDISVITNIGWTTNDLCAETNDYIMESVARYPGRLIGFCTVQPNSCDSATAEIERCAKGGIRGVGEMRPDVQAFDLREEAIIDPFIEVMLRHRLVLLTHVSEPVGHDYPGKGSITPDVLYPLITHYPDLTVVCAHWGGGLPFYALMPEAKEAMKNVFFDTAASPFLYSPQIYNHVIQLVGGDKILFGSDYPLMAPSRVLNQIKAQNLSEETERLILSGNARRLLGIP